jgi:hypothetical protein
MVDCQVAPRRRLLDGNRVGDHFVGETSSLRVERHDDDSLLILASIQQPPVGAGVVQQTQLPGPLAGQVEENVVSTLLSALPSGSYLVISHPTADIDPDSTHEAVAVARSKGLIFEPRSRDEVAAFFAGLDLVEPGVVQMPDWRPDFHDRKHARRVHQWVGVARKP